jgi:hypothetical protein
MIRAGKNMGKCQPIHNWKAFQKSRPDRKDGLASRASCSFNGTPSQDWLTITIASIIVNSGDEARSCWPERNQSRVRWASCDHREAIRDAQCRCTGKWRAIWTRLKVQLGMLNWFPPEGISFVKKLWRSYQFAILAQGCWRRNSEDFAGAWNFPMTACNGLGQSSCQSHQWCSGSPRRRGCAVDPCLPVVTGKSAIDVSL